LRETKLPVSNICASPYQLGPIAAPPGRGAEIVRDFNTPTRIEGVIVEAAPADDAAVFLFDNRPRRIAISPPKPFMDKYAAAALLRCGVMMGVTHSLSIAEELKKGGNIRFLRTA
jgi:hypothetical protein